MGKIKIIYHLTHNNSCCLNPAYMYVLTLSSQCQKYYPLIVKHGFPVLSPQRTQSAGLFHGGLKMNKNIHFMFKYMYHYFGNVILIFLISYYCTCQRGLGD